jgi:hypothetical protein
MTHDLIEIDQYQVYICYQIRILSLITFIDFRVNQSTSVMQGYYKRTKEKSMHENLE